MCLSMDLGKCPEHNRVLMTQLFAGTNDLQVLIDSFLQAENQNNIPKVIGSEQDLLIAVTLFTSPPWLSHIMM